MPLCQPRGRRACASPLVCWLLALRFYRLREKRISAPCGILSGQNIISGISYLSIFPPISGVFGSERKALNAHRLGIALTSKSPEAVRQSRASEARRSAPLTAVKPRTGENCGQGDTQPLTHRPAAYRGAPARQGYASPPAAPLTRFHAHGEGWSWGKGFSSRYAALIAI